MGFLRDDIINVKYEPSLDENVQEDGHYHSLTIEEACRVLSASRSGLTSVETQRRLGIYGRNSIEEEKINRLEIFLRQFKSPLIYVLFAASIIVLLVGDFKDLIVIAIILLVNGILGFYQELRVETAVRALRKLTESRVRVRRDDRVVELSSSELVPGDLMLLREGDLVTADSRLLSATGLAIDESSMTGESIPVDKDADALLPKDALPFELRNMVLAGTSVVRGSAEALVAKTGRRTYLASIAERAREKSPDSPLTKAIKTFSIRYVSIVLTILALIGIVAVAQGRAALEVAYTIVAQLVSAVPEGLPIVLTLVLVVGAMALSKRQTLARHLTAVETLGSATVIASDKTGTITEGRLTVRETFELDSEGMRLVAALCNDSDGETGDPIDVALARWVGRDFKEYREKHPRLWAHPFDTQRRYMATLNRLDGGSVMLMKGAYEALNTQASNKTNLEALYEESERMASDGLRVLAFGIAEGQAESPENASIRIVGLVGFMDPQKKGVKEAVAAARRAGIRVIMITGDHAATARAIARDVGIWHEGEGVLTGREIEAMTDEELKRALTKTTVLARILPEHKYRAVKVLQDAGEIVAVTGDGVNDVPALKAADLGIAMGGGSEAAKGAAKMVIVDNNIGVIVDAIRNGRVIAANIRKVIYYLTSTSIGELTLISASIVAGLPLPLLPIQILWVNLVTDGAQDKTFPFAKQEDDVMSRPPKKPQQQFFDRSQILRASFFGLSMGLVILAMAILLRDRYDPLVVGTIVFTTVVSVQWANGIQAQKEREPFAMNIRKSITINPYIFVGAGIGFLLQLLAVFVLNEWFETVPLNLETGLYVLVAFALICSLLEVRKWFELLVSERKSSAAGRSAASE